MIIEETSILSQGIIKFIHQHHLLSLATTENNIPWCASCFYVFDNEKQQFIITSDLETRHAKEALEQPVVAGTIALETAVIGKIRGIQFAGSIYQPVGKELNAAKVHYLKKFPYAVLMKTHIWIINAEIIKFTDNRLGFGKKILWRRSQ
ncbi:MAG: pyridoxamine 5'-phosphate oxidase family protein [Bacteroidota bacterium]